VVELREEAKPTHVVLDGPRGTAVLKVVVPAAQKSWVLPDEVAPLGVGRVLPQQGGSAAKEPDRKKGAFGWEFKKKGPSE
jgi:hypothetical protein